MKKMKVLYFLELQKFEKIKWSYFSYFWPPGRDFDNVCFLPIPTLDLKYNLVLNAEILHVRILLAMVLLLFSVFSGSVCCMGFLFLNQYLCFCICCMV